YCDSNELQSVVKMVDKNNLVFWKSEGNWSMHQMLLALLEITGKADVFISSYAMGETPARVLQQLWQNEVINNIVCVLDSRVEVRTAGSLQLIKGFCARMALVDTHAKVTIIKDDDSEISMAYFNGFYTSELSVRESILSLARSGSSPAHTMANKLFHDTRLNLRKQSYPGFDE